MNELQGSLSSTSMRKREATDDYRNSLALSYSSCTRRSGSKFLGHDYLQADEIAISA